MQEKMPTSSIWKFLLIWMCIWESHLDKSSTSHPEICTSPPALGSEIGGKKTGKPWNTRKIHGRTIGSGDQSWANTTYWICTFSNNQCLLSKPMMFFLQGFLGAFLFVMGLCGWRWIAPLLLSLALSKWDSPRLELLKWWWFQASSLCPRERHQICNSSLLNLKSWCFQRSSKFFSCITRYKIAEELGGGEHTQSSFYLALHSEGLYLACSGWIQFQQHLLFLSPHRCCMLCVPATRTNIFHWNHGECCVTGIFLNVSYFNETIFGY